MNIYMVLRPPTPYYESNFLKLNDTIFNKWTNETEDSHKIIVLYLVVYKGSRE